MQIVVFQMGEGGGCVLQLLLHRIASSLAGVVLNRRPNVLYALRKKKYILPRA